MAPFKEDRLPLPRAMEQLDEALATLSKLGDNLFATVNLLKMRSPKPPAYSFRSSPRLANLDQPLTEHPLRGPQWREEKWRTAKHMRTDSRFVAR